MNKLNFLQTLNPHLRLALILALLTGLVLSVWQVQLGQAATDIQVTTFEDKINTDGLCSLREAIISANKDQASSGNPGECPAGSGMDTISLPAGTYTLSRTDNGKEDSSSTGDLDISGDLTINAAGRVTINTISGFKDRVFHVLTGSVTINDLTISGGNTSEDGGGILNRATLTLVQSTLSGNRAGGRGGGIYSDSTVSLENTTLSGNLSKTDGGALYNFSGVANLNNVTVKANSADSDANGSGDGGGLFFKAGTIYLKNSILAGNFDQSAATTHPDCSGSLASQGYNLIQDITGCTVSGTATGNLIGVNPLLGDLADNGGSTFTYALAEGSPAVDAGNPAAPGSEGDACLASDQRGVARPQRAACDMGAFELEGPDDPAQTGPIFTVNTALDVNDGVCSLAHCSLREAILAANARPNDSSPDSIDSIIFSLPGSGPYTLAIASALPEISDPLILDGSAQAGGPITLDGNAAGEGINGLMISGGGSQVNGYTIQNFSGDGIHLLTNGGNLIANSTISLNGGAGVAVESGSGNTITNNAISGNNGLGIDLGAPGPEPNDPAESDSGANDLQNYPVLLQATPSDGMINIIGRLNSAPSKKYSLEFYANSTCDVSNFGEGETYLGSLIVTTDTSGNVVDPEGKITFLASFEASVSEGQFVVATATDLGDIISGATDLTGSTSEFSQCVSVGPSNDSWVKASRLTLVEELNEETVERYLDKAGQARWFKFKVTPGSKVVVMLTSLPANYDLTLYKDIGQAFSEMNSTEDLVRLSAEFAPDSFAPDSFAPDSFAADAFSPDSFAPDSFAPDSFAPDSFAPDSFAPDSFAPDSFAPDSFAPDSFAPDSFAPDSFAPDSFAPDSFAPDSFAPDSFASAQTRSLIAVSAFEGTAGEGIRVNTWENTGFFYVRVRGRNGVFSLQDPFHLEVHQQPGICADVNPDLPDNSLQARAGGFKTLILTDFERMGVTQAEKDAMLELLNALKARAEVAGEIVDVGADGRVSEANDLADAYSGCPFASNLVAYSIKSIVDAYAALNPLEYVVIVGNDHVIPFFRHPDHAMLANEKNYVPPVRDSTASQASLRLGYVLSQDDYGAGFTISVKDDFFPVPNLAVGRLVETPSDVINMLNTYLDPENGGVLTPTTALVTGYDFLADAAVEVKAELEAGLGTSAETLIAPREQSPQDPLAWTAEDLRAALLDNRHDLIFLAGHFSASSALAADYTTRLTTSEIVASDIDLSNALVFSPGCHAGYNIVNPHGIPNVTAEPDWAQAFAQKGVTLIGGTGYQYGDTDFIEYSERLYLELSKQLRTGSGRVSIGKALVAAKQAYLADTPQLRGIHEKALLEATLFGLPMSSVDMPGARLTPVLDDPIVDETSLSDYVTNPGQTLGLRYADVDLRPAMSLGIRTLTDITTSDDVEAAYLIGPNGVVANPSEPILPLVMANVSVPDMVLRGVGLRSGSYTDLPDLLPLLGAATTELRGVHTPFLTNVFYPVRFWHPNYFDALVNPASGQTRLAITPAQYISRNPGDSYGTFRRFNDLDFRLFYSANTETYCGDNNDCAINIPSTPSLSGSPTISQVTSTVDNNSVHFRMQVVGNPAAGIQEVWVTYTGVSGSFYGQWQSLDLDQNTNDSSIWEGTLQLDNMIAGDVRYLVQAVNGVGLVTQVTNLGVYYIPGVDSQPTLPTELALSTGAAYGAYGTEATFSAVLTSNGTPLANQLVSFALGPQNRRAVTDSSGQATVNMLLLGLPGTNVVRASFAGTAEYLVSSKELPFGIRKQDTQLTLEPHPDPDPITIQYSDGIVTEATLTDATGRRLGDQTIFFVVRGSNGTYTQPVITDYAGRASLLTVPLSLGSYTIDTYFSGTIPLPDLPPDSPLKLEDERYNPSYDSVSLDLQAEDATVTNTGPAQTSPGTSLTLTAVVTQAADGSLGDIGLAQARFDLRNSASSIIATQTNQVAADGSVSATFANGLPAGTYQVDVTVVGGYFTSQTASITLVVDAPPICSLALASPDIAWPPEHEWVAISVTGVTDPDGDPLTITIDRIFQDEPVGSGVHSPDGRGIGTSQAEVRAERDQNGNGRVYHIYFIATDPYGNSCSGEVKVGVPSDQGGVIAPIDGGPLYDSTISQ